MSVRQVFLALLTVGCFKKVFLYLSRTDPRCAHLKDIKITLAPRLNSVMYLNRSLVPS